MRRDIHILVCRLGHAEVGVWGGLCRGAVLDVLMPRLSYKHDKMKHLSGLEISVLRPGTAKCFERKVMKGAADSRWF